MPSIGSMCTHIFTSITLEGNNFIGSFQRLESFGQTFDHCEMACIAVAMEIHAALRMETALALDYTGFRLADIVALALAACAAWSALMELPSLHLHMLCPLTCALLQALTISCTELAGACFMKDSEYIGRILPPRLKDAAAEDRRLILLELTSLPSQLEKWIDQMPQTTRVQAERRLKAVGEMMHEMGHILKDQCLKELGNITAALGARCLRRTVTQFAGKSFPANIAVLARQTPQSDDLARTGN